MRFTPIITRKQQAQIIKKQANGRLSAGLCNKPQALLYVASLSIVSYAMHPAYSTPWRQLQILLLNGCQQ